MEFDFGAVFPDVQVSENPGFSTALYTFPGLAPKTSIDADQRQVVGDILELLFTSVSTYTPRPRSVVTTKSQTVTTVAGQAQVREVYSFTIIRGVLPGDLIPDA